MTFADHAIRVWPSGRVARSGRSRGFYKTEDAGESWTKLSNGLTYQDGPYKRDQAVIRVAIDPSDRQSIYAGALDEGVPSTGGVFKSDDGGMTWRFAGHGLETTGSRMVWDLVVDPRNSEAVYIATDDGIFQGHGREISWVPMNEGMSGLRTLHVALDPRPPGALYAGTGSGVFTLEPLPGQELPVVKGIAKED